MSKTNKIRGYHAGPEKTGPWQVFNLKTMPDKTTPFGGKIIFICNN